MIFVTWPSFLHNLLLLLQLMPSEIQETKNGVAIRNGGFFSSCSISKTGPALCRSRTTIRGRIPIRMFISGTVVKHSKGPAWLTLVFSSCFPFCLRCRPFCQILPHTCSQHRFQTTCSHLLVHLIRKESPGWCHLTSSQIPSFGSEVLPSHLASLTYTRCLGSA